MGWTNGDGEILERIASALERSANAEERRNDILERDLEARQKAWEASEERSNAALERLLGGPQPVPGPATEDPWRDLPEHDGSLRDRVHPG